MADWRAEFKGAARTAFASPVRIFFPPLCAGCRRLVSEPGALCAICWPSLRHLEPPWCPIMGTPFAQDMGEGFLSAEAIADPPPFGRLRAAVAYSAVARDMVQGLKYNDRTDLARWMARWMVRAGFEVIAETQLVVPVPLHRRRYFQRRFNQSAELGRWVARLCGLDFRPEAAVRVKATRQQVGLGERERIENVRGAFAVPPGARPLLAGRRVLIVDDVYTTGATVGALTRTLLRAGAAGVDVLTFARVLPGDFQREEHGLI